MNENTPSDAGTPSAAPSQNQLTYSKGEKMSTELSTTPDQARIPQYARAPAASLIMDSESMNSMLKIAELMASGKATVPIHLQKNPSDCLAIVMQAIQWGMSPFIVGQKTHVVNGNLGYEAQLVSAVVQASCLIKGHFHYEFKGQSPSLECRAGAVLAGDSEITWGQWHSENKVTTKNSPLWKTNPSQQLAYLQTKMWARLYCPGAILGIYTIDELETTTLPIKAGTVIDHNTGEIVSKAKELPEYTAAQLETNLPAWQAAINAGKITPEKIITKVSSGYRLTEGQLLAIRALHLVIDAPVPASSEAPGPDEELADEQQPQVGAL